jgi:hypothetical protein
MSCEEIRALFSDVADARLSPAEQSAWRAHLASCTDCHREWESFQRTLEMLRGLPRHRAPAGFVDRVMTAVSPQPWPRRLARRLFVPLPVNVPLQAAALALLVIAGVYLVQRTPEMQQAMRDVEPRSGPTSVPAAPAAPSPATPASPAPSPRAPGESPAAPVPAPPAAAESRLAPVQSPGAPAASSSAPSPERRLPAATPEGKGRADQTAASENAPAKAAEEAAPRPAPGVQAPRRELYGGGLARQERIRATGAAAPLVVGRLTVEDREAAGAALAALIASVGATERSRTRVEDGTLIELDVPHARYAEFTRGLAAIGGWTPREERGGPGADVRVRVVVGPPAR